MLIKREKLFKDMKIKYKELKTYLNNAYVSGLSTHYEKLPLYWISPEEETEILR
jgi:hypothetical protein